MASNYELEYKKIHNTLEKEAEPNSFGYRIGQRISNLLEPYVLGATNLKSDIQYNSYKTLVWRDDVSTTKALAFDLIDNKNILEQNAGPIREFSPSTELEQQNPFVINSDFYTPPYVLGLKSSKIYCDQYESRWYLNTKEALFCPNTLDLVNGHENNEYISRHDFRSVFKSFADSDGQSYEEEILGAKAEKTLISHKVYLEQDTNYMFQMVNRYNKWPNSSHIIVQYFIENDCLTCDPVARVRYCQPVFKPIVLKNIQPDIAFCLKTPLLEKGQYYLPKYISEANKKLNIWEASKPKLYAIFYITNTNVDKNEWTITEEEKKYNLKDYRFFLFKSDFSYEISENGTILSYQSLKVEHVSSELYGLPYSFKTVYDTVRPVLNQTKPLIKVNPDKEDPYISVCFDTNLSIKNIEEFKDYFASFPDIYYKDNEGKIKKVFEDWREDFIFSTKVEGPYSTWSKEEFKKNLSDYGTIYKKEQGIETIGWKEGREFFSSNLEPIEIVQLLLAEDKEIVLVPQREVVGPDSQNSGRDRSWHESHYITSQNPTALRLIDSTNPVGKNKKTHSLEPAFKKSVEFFCSPRRFINKYWTDSTGTKHKITGWTPESNYKPWLNRGALGKTPRDNNTIIVEGTNTVMNPYINIGAFRFPIFYREKEEMLTALNNNDLVIKFYTQSGPGPYNSAFRPRLKIENESYSPFSGTSNGKVTSTEGWFTKTIKNIDWYKIDFKTNTSSKNIINLSNELIGYDNATTKYKAQKFYYKANGTRQTIKPSALNYTFYTFELTHILSHAYLKDYERSFLPWVARMRASSLKGSLTDNHSVAYNNSSFIGLSFKWAIVNRTEALAKNRFDNRIDTNDKVSVFGDRFGLWGRGWADGYAPKEGITDYIFPASNPILISQYVGQYPNIDDSYEDTIKYQYATSPLKTAYNGTSITYTIPGRRYSTEKHQPSEVETQTTIDIAPFCWGSGEITSLTNTWRDSKGLSRTKTYIAVVDNFNRDKNK